jgi:hypothetical protein
MTLATAAPIVVRQSRAVNTGGISPAADEMTAGRHLHLPVTIGTCHAADAAMAAPHPTRRHLALSETTIDTTTVEVVAAVSSRVIPRRAVSSAQRLGL